MSSRDMKTDTTSSVAPTISNSISDDIRKSNKKKIINNTQRGKRITADRVAKNMKDIDAERCKIEAERMKELKAERCKIEAEEEEIQKLQMLRTIEVVRTRRVAEEEEIQKLQRCKIEAEKEEIKKTLEEEIQKLQRMKELEAQRGIRIIADRAAKRMKELEAQRCKIEAEKEEIKKTLKEEIQKLQVFFRKLS